MLYLRWQSRKRKRSKFGSWLKSDTHWRAILIQKKRVDGEWKQCHVAYLIGFTESAAAIIHQRYHLWNTITERLDALKINKNNRAQIEAKIAVKMPRLTRAQHKKVMRDIALISASLPSSSKTTANFDVVALCERKA
jgi:hypothetical protein